MSAPLRSSGKSRCLLCRGFLLCGFSDGEYRNVGLVVGEIGLEGLVVLEQGDLLPLKAVNLAGLLGYIIICLHWRIDSRQVCKAES